jgi:peptidoglycan/xylan/chitin deacetylase (PgdA/CDA1 family)
VDTSHRVAALTFDDGPDPRFTPPLLDLLERHGARATFFVVGQRARQHPALLERAHRAGHAVGCHSWDHRAFPCLSGRERRRQLRACRDALGGRGQSLFRPPYGLQNLPSRLDALRAGHEVIGWSVDVGDWFQPDPASMVRAALRAIRPGAILLFHDALAQPIHPGARDDRGAMLHALDALLVALGGAYRFVTVPELLRCGRPVRENWYTCCRHDGAPGPSLCLACDRRDYAGPAPADTPARSPLAPPTGQPRSV